MENIITMMSGKGKLMPPMKIKAVVNDSNAEVLSLVGGAVPLVHYRLWVINLRFVPS
jgi:hypothetical protein